MCSARLCGWIPQPESHPASSLQEEFPRAWILGAPFQTSFLAKNLTCKGIVTPKKLSDKEHTCAWSLTRASSSSDTSS